MNFDGRSVLYGLYGYPVGHSVSPPMQNAAFAAYGIDAVYQSFNVEPAALAEAVKAIRSPGMGGVNLTIPHKRAVVKYLDKTEGKAAASGSVNTIVRRDGRLVGYSTDGEGFIRSLREEAGLDLIGKKVCLLGTGGAALALAVRLRREGVGALVVITRQASRDKIEWPTGVVSALEAVLTYEMVQADPKTLADCSLIVNATPLGMSPLEDAMPEIPCDVFRSGVVLYDLIYRPARTKLMCLAEAAGATVMNGLGMLVYQGAASFELWTGQPAPVAAMRIAATNALYQS